MFAIGSFTPLEEAPDLCNPIEGCRKVGFIVTVISNYSQIETEINKNDTALKQNVSLSNFLPNFNPLYNMDSSVSLLDKGQIIGVPMRPKEPVK